MSSSTVFDSLDPGTFDPAGLLYQAELRVPFSKETPRRILGRFQDRELAIEFALEALTNAFAAGYTRYVAFVCVLHPVHPDCLFRVVWSTGPRMEDGSVTERYWPCPNQ